MKIKKGLNLFRLNSILLLLGLTLNLFSQNPHGADLKINCASCHNAAGWEIKPEFWQNKDQDKKDVSIKSDIVKVQDSLHFNHNSTKFELKGRHTSIDCRSCHQTLVFSEANSDCVSCHKDMHQQTLGRDCARCHNSSNWFVDNISGIHQENGFPLTGVHKSVSCEKCHTSASNLEFNRIGNDCVSCHLKDFNSSSNPNHKQAGFSKDCIECHDVFKPGWTTTKINHDFFPLTKGHEISDCAKCHTSGDYANTSKNCYACHQPDFEKTINPNHQKANFSNDCATCHTTDLNWMPAKYLQHDDFFPIYSGKHKGTWLVCKDCHMNSSNYAEFSCTNCHINPATDNGHKSVSGYIYENTACLACHQTGNTTNVFDHNKSNFPLTGAHSTVNCIQCHSAGYTGTPTQCSACHTPDYNKSKNPNHVALNLPTDCASCHTTQPGWQPATFAIHNNYYALKGAHAAIATNCAICHNGNYNNTPNTCNACHSANYNATKNPNHVDAKFPTDCATCHSETAWTPSSFDHSIYYPLTGAHLTIANDCNSCHKGKYTNTPNTCTDCHNEDYNKATNPNHVALNLQVDCSICHTTTPGWKPASFAIHDNYYKLKGAHTSISNNCVICHNGNYVNPPNTCFGCHAANYNATKNPNHVTAKFPTDCATCHSETAWSPATFDHNSVYPFTGAHIGIANDCNACHNGNYTNTPNTCAGCHTSDFNKTTNPNHLNLKLSNDCASCHTTKAGWQPAKFSIHNNYYALNGAHALIADNCVTCHNGNYNSTPNTCNGCHNANYNSTTNPNHKSAQFPTDCASCHSETKWTPANFDHDSKYFPIYSGKHKGKWSQCIDCHANPAQYSEITCTNCHTNPQTNNQHNGVGGYSYNSSVCLACHPTGSAGLIFNHNTTSFPLNGAHSSTACIACHASGFAGKSTQCSSCHIADYNMTTNPNHISAQLPTNCATCHTETAWTPSSFDHSKYYPFKGAHIAISNNCNICHNGNYTNTPNTCAGCHTPEYNATTNPNHTSAQFPTNCENCHTEAAWVPANFNHDGQYFPIYSGKHKGVWNQCIDCHANPTNYPEVTCTNCHTNPQTDNAHGNVGGYSYNSTACLACHPNGEANNSFNHNTSNFPLTGAHITVDCIACHANGYAGTPTQCAACHTNDYNQSSNPSHVTLNLSTDCATCHTTAPGWSPATFAIHNSFYQLNGAHAAISNDCNACHNGNYNNTPNTCYGCHTTDYNSTNNPNHGAANFSTNCTDCHGENTWVPSTFNHNVYYPLTGAHLSISNDCNACHNGNYNNTPNTCVACHTTDYNGSTNPNHNTLNIPTDCASCHTTEPGWAPATFGIHNNYWQLNGAHANISNQCSTCHNGDYNNTPNTCYGCHAQDYSSSTNPDHAAAQFPTTCQTCHNETAWIPSTFDHSIYYPFTGAHISIQNDCNACHNGNYNNTPNTCAGCHTPDYNASTNPNHVSLNIPTDCAMCHTTNPDWEPATFPIHNNYWPLIGAHATISDDCAACHNGNYNNTPTTCYGCHAADYNSATNPNHASAQFPTTCQDCHTQTAWSPSTFNHDQQYFKIYSGKHKNKWDLCIDCHTNPNNYAQFSCIVCHNNQNELSNDHENVPGYQYNNNACYSCHPTGNN